MTCGQAPLPAAARSLRQLDERQDNGKPLYQCRDRDRCEATALADEHWWLENRYRADLLAETGVDHGQLLWTGAR